MLDGRSHVRQKDYIRRLKAKGKARGTEDVFGGAEKVNKGGRDERVTGLIKKGRSVRNCCRTHASKKNRVTQKTECEHRGHISMNPLKGRP